MFRLVPPVPSPEAQHVFCSAPPAGREVPTQMEMLMKDNERLKQELESHAEKALRIQKVKSSCLPSPWSLFCYFYTHRLL